MLKGRTAIFVQNSATAMILQILSMLSGFLIPKVMIENYGSEINGLVVSLMQIIGCLSLVEAGIANAAICALYKPLAEKNALAISGILTATKNFYYKSGYLFIALLCALSLLYPIFITINSLPNWEVAILVLVLGGSVICDFFTLAKYRALLTADQKLYVISLVSAIAVLINTSIIIGLSLYTVDIVIVRICALLSVFFRTFVLRWYVKTNYKFIDYNSLPDNNSLGQRWNALFLQLLGQVQTGAPIILITFLTSLSMVSIYSIYNLVMVGINALLSIFISGLSSSFGDLLARNEMIKIREIYKQFEMCYYAIIAVVYSVAMITITPFVLLYTRNAIDLDYNHPEIGFLLVINGLLFNLKTPQGMMVIAAGWYKQTRWQSTIQAIIVCLGGVVGGCYIGLEGIILGSIVANLYRDIELGYFIPKKLLLIKPWESYKRMLLCLIIMLTIISPVFYFNLFICNSYYELIAGTFILMLYAIIFSAIYVFTFQRSIFLNIKKRLNFGG